MAVSPNKKRYGRLLWRLNLYKERAQIYIPCKVPKRYEKTEFEQNTTNCNAALRNIGFKLQAPFSVYKIGEKWQ